MAQYGRPISDEVAGSWTDEGTVDNDGSLYTSVDEVTQDGGDSYILADGVNTTCELKLSPVTDPGGNTGYILRVWMRASGGGSPERLILHLFEGGTLRASSGNFTNRSGSYAEKTYELIPAEADAITAFNDLRIKIESSNLSSSDDMLVTQAEFEVPDAGGVLVTFTGAVGGISNIPDTPLKRTREFVSVAVAGVSNIVDATFKRVRRFTAPAVEGISSLIADITVTAGGVVQALQGSIGAISDIADVPFKRIRSFIGVSVDVVSDVAGVFKRIRKFVGEIISPDVLTDGELDMWLSATNLQYWIEQQAGSSTVNQESGDKHSGAYSCRMDCDSSNNDLYIYQANPNFGDLTPGDSYVLRFWYKMSTTGKTWGVRIRDNGSNVYLQNDGSWSATPNYIPLPEQTSWTEFILQFTAHPDYSVYALFIRRTSAASSSLYVDKISIRPSNSQVSGILGRVKGFIGVSIDALSSVLGVMRITRAFVGSIGAISGVADAPLKRLRKFIGTSIDAVSSVLGDIQELAVAEVLYKWINGQPVQSDDLNFEWVGGQPYIINNATVVGGLVKALQAVVGAISGVAGSIKGTFSFSGSAGEVSGVGAVLKRSRKFISTTVEGISSIIGQLTVGAEVLLRGVIDAVSGVSANILVAYVLRGVVGTVSGVDAALGRVRTFIGAIGSASGVDAVLKRARRFVGVSIDAVSSVLGNIQKGGLQALQGLVEGVSGVTGSIRGLFTFSGGVDSASGVSGFMKVLYTLKGVAVGGISFISGLLSTLGTVNLRGVVEALSGVTGSLKATKAFIGSLSSAGVVEGVLKVARKFVSIIVSGASSVSGVLKRGRRFIGVSVSGLASVVGNLKVTRAFVGVTITVVSSVSGVLTIGGVVILRGVIGAVSGVDGVLKTVFSIKGTVDSASSVLGSLKYSASLSGLVEAVSGLTGTITTAAAILFQGITGAISSVDGAFSRLRGFTGTISSASGVGGALKRIRAYIGSVVVSSSAASAFKRLRRVSGSITGSSTVDGYVKILYRFIGSITSGSTVTAILGRVKKFVGATVSAVSSITADLWAGVLYVFPIIFQVIPRERIKSISSRIKAFIVEARERIFKSDIDEDR